MFMNASEKLLPDTIGSTSNDAKWLWASEKIAYLKKKKKSFVNCKGKSLKRFALGDNTSFYKVSELLHSVQSYHRVKK